MRDPGAMAEQLEKFYYLPLEKLTSIREAAREKIEKQHQKKQMVSGMERLYEKVLEKHSN